MIIKSSLPKIFGASGLTIWPFIFMVNPDDQPLVAHEKVHFAEQARWLVLPWWVAYLLSAAFRKNTEVRAYKAQIAAGGDIEMCAFYLARNYRLGITAKQAKQELS